MSCLVLASQRSHRPGSTAIGALLMGCLLASPAWSQITSFGSVNPNPPAGGGTVSGTIVVGDENDDVSSLVGFLDIAGGSTLTADRLILGEQQEWIGDVTITGLGSAITLTESSSLQPALQVGDEGTGFLTVNAGASVVIPDNNGSLVLGREPTGLGVAVFEDRFTQLFVGDNVFIGQEGHGELTLRNGARAIHTDGDDGLLEIGGAATGTGLVTVEGAGTFWQLPSVTNIGVAGTGTLRVGAGAIVDSNNDFPGTGITVGPTGVFELYEGGRVLADALTVDGRLEGDGFVAGPVTVNAGGEVNAAPSNTLRFSGAVANSGLINVTGVDDERGEIEFFGVTTNVDPGGGLPGRIAVGNGVVRFNAPLMNDGVLASTSGTTDFHGTITNSAAGLIAIGGMSNATFFDTVVVPAGTLNIAAGSTALFLGDITISAGSTLAITLDESSVDDGFETPVQSLGELTLDVPISLTVDGFVPEEGDSFELISAAGGVSIGVIDPNNFDPLPGGLNWDVLISGDSVTALVVGGGGGVNPGGGVVEGDFNGDGVVNIADYTVWRDALGQTGQGLAADADGSGVVDADDYQLWSDNYGRVTTPLLASGAVPEPAAALLLLMATLAVATRRSR